MWRRYTKKTRVIKGQERASHPKETGQGGVVKEDERHKKEERLGEHICIQVTGKCPVHVTDRLMLSSKQ